MPPPSPTDTYRGTRVLVTGGAGFIGSTLARRLLDLGADVRVLDDLSTGHRRNLPEEAVDLRVASILDDAALLSAVDGCAVVFHLAAMVSVPDSVARPVACAEINTLGTERVLEAARAAGAGRLVFVSSAAVYGPAPRLPSRESDPIDCASPYAASKAAGEALVTAYGRCYEMTTVSLRYFNVFGAGQDPASPYAAAIAAFTDALRRGEAPRLHGDGHQTRDFIHVDDVVEATLRAGACPPEASGSVLNVATGRRTSLREVIGHLARALGVEAAPVSGPPRAGDVRDSVADVERARAVLGYEPRVTLAEGLARLVAHSADAPSAPPSSPPPSRSA